MLQFGQFSACISIDGRQTREYAIEVSENERTVTCWIASELGSASFFRAISAPKADLDQNSQRFSVEWRNASYSHPTRGKVVVDGISCGARVLRARTLPDFTSKSGISDAHCVKPFVFSALELTDDDAFLGGPAHLSDLGVINLTIHAIEITGNTYNPQQRELSELKVHERSKKAVTQQIMLAEPEFFRTPIRFTTSKKIGSHLVQFFFKYRPADVLRANGIMPQLKPKPSDVLADAEEERYLRERLHALEAKRLKRETETETKPRVKREADDPVVASTRVKKKVKLEGFTPGEIIDLT